MNKAHMLLVLALSNLVIQTNTPLYAGLFDMPAFLEPGSWSVGMEPEIIISKKSGAGLNFKPRYGMNDILNWQALLGTGSGPRNFRVGATADFEWFPDYEGQIGIATPLFLEYFSTEASGVLALGVRPMVYKSFYGEGATYTPFFGVPLGWDLQDGEFKGVIQIVLGSMFRMPKNKRWGFSVEAGFDAKDSYSYLSGGATYFF
jgi:hypothetical protein